MKLPLLFSFLFLTSSLPLVYGYQNLLSYIVVNGVFTIYFYSIYLVICQMKAAIKKIDKINFKDKISIF